MTATCHNNVLHFKIVLFFLRSSFGQNQKSCTNQRLVLHVKLKVPCCRPKGLKAWKAPLESQVMSMKCIFLTCKTTMKKNTICTTFYDIRLKKRDQRSHFKTKNILLFMGIVWVYVYLCFNF